MTTEVVLTGGNLGAGTIYLGKLIVCYYVSFKNRRHSWYIKYLIY